jgi:hypothetical protein
MFPRAQINGAALRATDRKPIATQALQFYWQCIAHPFRFPLAYFFTTSGTTVELATWVPEGITLLTSGGFNVMGLLCDGGSANRAFFKVRRPPAVVRLRFSS